MIKFECVTAGTTYYCDTKDTDYRRDGQNCWYQRYSESWESVYFEEELEQALQDWIKEHGDPKSEEDRLAQAHLKQSVYYKDLIFDLLEGKKTLDEVRLIFQCNYEERGYPQ